MIIILLLTFIYLMIYYVCIYLKYSNSINQYPKNLYLILTDILFIYMILIYTIIIYKLN